MSKDLSDKLFKERIAKNLTNKTLRNHNQLTDPNTSEITDHNEYIQTGKKKLPDFVKIMKELIPEE